MFGWRNKRVSAPRVAVSAQPFLNLGCGGHFHPDWTNVDIAPRDPSVIQHDLQQALPYADGSFLAVYHSHVLEHIPRKEAPLFLQECKRVLQPGGVLRVVVPDLEMIARLYLENLTGALSGNEEAALRHEWMTLELLDQMVRDVSGGEMLRYWRRQPMPAEQFVFGRMGAEVRRWIEGARNSSGPQPPEIPLKKPSAAELGRFRQSGEVHKWMYDQFSLGRLLEQIGFVAVKRCAAHESGIPNFATYHLDVEPEGTIRKPDSLFIEARKPPVESQ